MAECAPLAWRMVASQCAVDCANSTNVGAIYGCNGAIMLQGSCSFITMLLCCAHVSSASDLAFKAIGRCAPACRCRLAFWLLVGQLQGLAPTLQCTATAAQCRIGTACPCHGGGHMLHGTAWPDALIDGGHRLAAAALAHQATCQQLLSSARRDAAAATGRQPPGAAQSTASAADGNVSPAAGTEHVYCGQQQHICRREA